MMFAEVHLARVKQAFVGQFTPDGPGFVYRQGRRGPGVRVSAAERDAFVMAFDRALVRLGWGAFLTGAVTFGALEAFPPDLPEPLRGQGETIAIVSLTLAFLVMWWRIRNAPMRALARRATIDQGIAGEDFRRAALVAMPWSMPAFAALFMVGLAVRVAWLPDPLAPQHWGYYAFAAFGVVAMALLAWVKWRASR